MKNAIKDLPFDKIKTNKFFKNDAFESIVVSIEKGNTLKKHTSHKEVCLVMLEGSIYFYINDEKIELSALDSYHFDKEVEHEVEAVENAKFLLIR